MAEIRKLDGSRVEQTLNESQALIREELEGLLEANERGEISSLFVLIASPAGQTSIAIRRGYEDSIAFLGQLEILKADVLARMRELRQ